MTSTQDISIAATKMHKQANRYKWISRIFLGLAVVSFLGIYASIFLSLENLMVLLLGIVITGIATFAFAALSIRYAEKAWNEALNARVLVLYHIEENK